MNIVYTYENVHAIRAYDSNYCGGDESKHESGVIEGRGHGQNPSAETSLQQVHKSFHIPEKSKRSCKRRSILCNRFVKFDDLFFFEKQKKLILDAFRFGPFVNNF